MTHPEPTKTGYELMAIKKVPAQSHEHSYVRKKMGSDHEIKGISGFPTWECACGEKIKAS